MSDTPTRSPALFAGHYIQTIIACHQQSMFTIRLEVQDPVVLIDPGPERRKPVFTGSGIHEHNISIGETGADRMFIQDPDAFDVIAGRALLPEKTIGFRIGQVIYALVMRSDPIATLPVL